MSLKEETTTAGRDVILFRCPEECYVYRVPPAGTLGHRAELWNVESWLAEVSTSVIRRCAPVEVPRTVPDDVGATETGEDTGETRQGVASELGPSGDINDQEGNGKNSVDDAECIDDGRDMNAKIPVIDPHDSGTQGTGALQGHREKMNDDSHIEQSQADEGVIRLCDASTGEVFAEAPLILPLRTCVEPVIDSSRYFVLRVVDPSSGNHAFIGLGFRERSKASDFMAALDEYSKYVARQKKAADMKREKHGKGDSVQEEAPSSNDDEHGPKHSLSLDPDEHMRLSLGALSHHRDGGFVSRNKGKLSKTFSLMFGKDGESVAALAPSREKTSNSGSPMEVTPKGSDANQFDEWSDFKSAS